VRVHVLSRVSPVEILGEGGRVTGIRLERNALEPDGRGGVRAVGTGRTEILPVGLVFRAVGYRGKPIPGVPFDAGRGTIPNRDGRVVAENGEIVPRTYVVGWAKRGPSGLIGTNRADSKETVERFFEDLPGIDRSPPRTAELALRFLRARQPELVTWTGWKRLDAVEVSEGEKRAKIRHKVTHLRRMVDHAVKE
jgi:ferredoxin--NADP+ reductase